MFLKRTSIMLAVMLLATVAYFHYDHGDTIIHKERILQENKSNAEHEMIVTVFLTIDNFRLLLSSAFFRAALEQTLKDYVNGAPECVDRSSNKNDIDLVSYTSFALDLAPQLQANVEEKKDVNKTSCVLLGSNWGNIEDITCYIEVKTKCRGSREECKKQFNDRLLDNNIVQKSNKTESQKGFCDLGLNDLLGDRSTFSSIFNYHVLDSESFDFDFQQSNEKLAKTKDIKAEHNNTQSNNVPCLDQCQAQHQTLQDIYEDFGEDFFYDGDHECDHKGLNCNQNNIVTSIWLNNMDLNTPISERFIGLQHLKEIYLSNNQIIGTIPEILSKLRKLETLWLENNQISGHISLDLVRAKHLREISFKGNQLNSTIPSDLLYKASLELLNLAENDLSGTIPDLVEMDGTSEETELGGDCTMFPNFISKFARKIYQNGQNTLSENKLSTLSLYDNRLTGTLPSSLFGLPDLSILSLGLNFLSGTLPSEIGNAKALKVLDLRGDIFDIWEEETIPWNKLTGQMPSEIGAASSLEVINLYSNNFNGTIPPELFELKHLKEITLDYNGFTGPIPDFPPGSNLEAISAGGFNRFEMITWALSSTLPSSISNLRKTKVLNFRGNSLSGSIPSEIGKMEKLEQLVLSSNNLNGTLPSELGNLSNLRDLRLLLNDLSGTIPTELGLLTNLDSIILWGNNLSGSVPSELFALPNVYIYVLIDVGSWWAGNDNLYSLCDAYYDADKIDMPCDEGRGVPSAVPSISLIPSSYSPPTIALSASLNPSSLAPTPINDCRCEPGNFKFHLELKMDDWPGDTSWRIQDDNGDILHNETGYTKDFKIFNYEYCLPVGCYNFIIDDSFGDGICCGYYGDGYYRGSVYGWEEVFDGGQFRFEAVENFCGEDLCPSATHRPSNSPSASSRPSISPQPSTHSSTPPSSIPSIFNSSDNDNSFDNDVSFHDDDPTLFDDYDDDNFALDDDDDDDNFALDDDYSYFHDDDDDNDPTLDDDDSYFHDDDDDNDPTLDDDDSYFHDDDDDDDGNYFHDDDLVLSLSSPPTISSPPSLIQTSSSAPSMDPQIIQIPNTPFYFHADGKTWDDCRSHAENYHFNFASIRNQEENNAVADYLSSNNIWIVWFGGYQTNFEDEPAGNWAWLDGTPWTDSTYTNWRPGQPNNIRRDEHHLYLWVSVEEWYDGNKDKEYPCIFRDPTA